MAAHQEALEALYADRSTERWVGHSTYDSLTRYLRDRRLHTALALLRKRGRLHPSRQSALVVCGGVGGEGTFLSNQGFADVTVSDISESALEICRERDPRLKTLPLNAEALDIPDGSFDLVLVQDGLHHLRRPPLGLTEMLRVGREAAIVIEPHFGLIGKLIGTDWERHGDAVNYVFRWSEESFAQVTKSYLGTETAEVVVRRLWDHNLVVAKTVHRLPTGSRKHAARGMYAALSPFNRLGNMFVGVALKPSSGT
jgi:ubiquinone/menaquinone biosynthesis C-methylase UbiE